MKFQLVLQFVAHDLEDFDSLILLEEELRRLLPSQSVIDGHDCIRGEFNIFILTHEPVEAFQAAKVIIQQMLPQMHWRAAYRVRSEGEFQVLWPQDLRQFVVT